MQFKFHKNPESCFVSICDTNLLGKKFEEDKKQLDITNFYKGQEKNDDEIEPLLKGQKNILFIGEKSVQLGVKLKLVEKQNIQKIKNIPYAQFISF